MDQYKNSSFSTFNCKRTVENIITRYNSMD